VHEKLKEMKGTSSYSDTIESMMNKLGIVMPASIPQQDKHHSQPQKVRHGAFNRFLSGWLKESSQSHESQKQNHRLRLSGKEKMQHKKGGLAPLPTAHPEQISHTNSLSSAAHKSKHGSVLHAKIIKVLDERTMKRNAIIPFQRLTESLRGCFIVERMIERYCFQSLSAWDLLN